MPAAARVEDPITHTNAFSGLLAGVLVGAVIGAVIVGSGGTAAPLLIASAACTGGALGGMAGEFLGRVAPPETAGKIVDGSHNVRINGKAAGFCSSKSACDRHSGPVVVAQGSSTVRINGNAAARTGDKGSCGFAVGKGSPNVNIGGAAGACAEVADEVPGWAHTMVFVLGLAGPGLGLKAGGMAFGAIAARLGLSVLGSEAGGQGMHALGGRLFGEGSWQQTAMTAAGSVVGGGLGYGAGAAADRVPRLNPFNYRPEPIPGALGSNLGNVRGRYVGPATEGAGPTAPPRLLPGEGKVGRFGDLDDARVTGDNLTPHHMPADRYMKGQGVSRDDGIAMQMEQPNPGSGGRHRITRSYGRGPDLNETPRQALARDIMDVRRIYKEQGLYTPEIRGSLQEVIRQNRAAHPHIFGK